MCKKALNINKSIERGLQVICVISVILFVVIALAIFLLFHFIILRYFFGKSAAQLVMKIAL